MPTVRFEERLLAEPPGADWITRREGKILIIQVEPGFSISTAVQSGQLKFSQPMAVVINGVSSDLSQKLQAGDEARLLPQIAGGKACKKS